MRESIARLGRDEARPSRIFARTLVAAFCAAAVDAAMADARPAHLWNFDRLGWDSRQAQDVGAAKTLREMRGRIAVGQGVRGSDALRADVASGGEVTRLPLPFAAWTFDCSLRVDVPNGDTKTRPVFRYETSATNSVAVTMEWNRIAVRSGLFSAVSEPQNVADGKLHALRLSVSADGFLRMWLDGKCVIEKSGAPSLLAQGQGDSKNGYPVLRFGMSGSGAVLGGVMDDIAIYDCALDAPVAAASVGDYSRVAMPEYRAVPPSDGAEVLVLGEGGAARTAPFRVADAMDAQVFGQMNPAAAKFVNAAASATMSVSGGMVRIAVDCPVPADMEPQRSSDVWSGDNVLVLIRPKSDEPLRLCYCVNATGGTAAEGREGMSRAKMSVAHSEWGFSVSINVPVDEVFGGVPPKPGDTFGINFIRNGRTCGGHSSWATNGGMFNDSKWTFGTAVFGGAKPYFIRRLADARERGASVAGDDASAHTAVDTACQAVEKAITAHGDDPAAFASLERMFNALDRTLLVIAQRGRPLLVYRPKDAWGNVPEPDLDSRPLEIIRIRTPCNTRRVVAFAIANLQSEPFVGNLKFFDRLDGFYRTGSRLPPPKDGVARRFTLRRSITVSDRDGRAMYDPLAELPLRSTVEVAPGKALPIFAELDTHGVAPGRHYALMYLRSATAGFPDSRIAVEVTVTDDDLDTVPLDRLASTHLATSFGAGCPVVRPATNCVRKLIERGYNIVRLSRFDDMYPVCDTNGVWQRPSYAAVDRYIDAWLAGGIDPKRLKIEPYIGVERETRLWRGLRDANDERVPFGTPRYDEGLRAFVRFLAEHLRARYGIGRDRIIWFPVDEASGDPDDPTFKSSASREMHAGRVIRAENPANILLWDPLPTFVSGDSDAFHRAMKEGASLFDILVLYRPAVSPKVVSLVKSLGVKNVWGYHISVKYTPAETYRSAVWKHLRDGFRDTMSYWHLDESAALDARPQHPYGTCYIDWDADELMLSRRQLAADMAAEEGRLVNYLRLKWKGDPAKLAGIESIVKAAADGGSMAAMDAALERLLELL